MKTTTTLKTLTLAAATGLFAGVAYSPALKAVEWEPQGYVTVDTTETYDHIIVEGANVTIITGGNVHGNGVIAVGLHTSWGTITVAETGKLSGDGMYMTRGSELIILDEGKVELGGYNLEVDPSYNASISVIGQNAILHVGHIRGPESGNIILGYNGSLLIDAGTVVANELVSSGGELEIINGGRFRAYSDGTAAGVVSVSNLKISLGLSTGHVWRTPIVIDEHVAIIGVPQLTIKSDRTFEGDTSFTIIEAVEGINYEAFGSEIVDSATGQVFTVVGDIHSITLTAQAVPEPSTYALLGGVGAVALAVLRRRRRRG